jgi:hypothetical protein
MIRTFPIHKYFLSFSHPPALPIPRRIFRAFHLVWLFIHTHTNSNCARSYKIKNIKLKMMYHRSLPLTRINMMANTTATTKFVFFFFGLFTHKSIHQKKEKRYFFLSYKKYFVDSQNGIIISFLNPKRKIECRFRISIIFALIDGS